MMDGNHLQCTDSSDGIEDTMRRSRQVVVHSVHGGERHEGEVNGSSSRTAVSAVKPMRTRGTLSASQQHHWNHLQLPLSTLKDF
jgi:hypothetical protein